MNRRSFLATLVAAPLALRAKANPFIHPWIYKPTQAQRDFINSKSPRMLYGVPYHQDNASTNIWLGIRRKDYE